MFARIKLLMLEMNEWKGEKYAFIEENGFNNASGDNHNASGNRAD